MVSKLYLNKSIFFLRVLHLLIQSVLYLALFISQFSLELSSNDCIQSCLILYVAVDYCIV